MGGLGGSNCRNDINDISDKSQHIHLPHAVVPAEPVQIHTACFLDRVAGEPPSELGRVEAVAVVVEAECAMVSEII